MEQRQSMKSKIIFLTCNFYVDRATTLKVALHMMFFRLGSKGMTHKYTIEMIFHFTCGKCKHWWSIADTHHKDKNVYGEGKAYCPHCGKESITEKMNPIS